MNEQDVLIELLKYFSAFVPKEVLKKTFVKKKGAAPGYEQLVTEMMSAPDDLVIAGIDNFVFSSNEAFLSQQIKNTEGIALYVEYGAFSYTPNQRNGIKEKLAIHVAAPYNEKDNDNLSETLLMNRMHNILCNILNRMEKDQNGLDFCSSSQLIVFPAEIVAIEPKLFYERAGWMAIFNNSLTNLL
ncbi:MAG: hypothetical protein LUH22_01215 [Bacteroides sp.]|nr:hypothetical protein [Bacteroides sp.]